MITTPPDPCWIVDDPDREEAFHGETEAEAVEEAERRVAEEGGRTPSPVKRLDRPCVVAKCTRCRERLQDYETGGDVHFDDVENLADAAVNFGFVIRDGRAWCGDCLPEGSAA